MSDSINSGGKTNIEMPGIIRTIRFTVFYDYRQMLLPAQAAVSSFAIFVKEEPFATSTQVDAGFDEKLCSSGRILFESMIQHRSGHEGWRKLEFGIAFQSFLQPFFNRHFRIATDCSSDFFDDFFVSYSHFARTW
jgi:hypothetical protein